jgi:hypothetical protein
MRTERHSVPPNRGGRAREPASTFNKGVSWPNDNDSMRLDATEMQRIRADPNNGSTRASTIIRARSSACSWVKSHVGFTTQ